MENQVVQAMHDLVHPLFPEPKGVEEGEHNQHSVDDQEYAGVWQEHCGRDGDVERVAEQLLKALQIILVPFTE